MYKVVVDSGDTFTVGTLTRCLELIQEGGAVNVESARLGLPLAHRLAVATLDDQIIGVGAIKAVRRDYTESIGNKANFPFPSDTREIGYVAVHPRHRKSGVARSIVASLVAHDSDRLFATTSSDAMKKILAWLQFQKVGVEWDGQRGDKISLWLRG